MGLALTALKVGVVGKEHFPHRQGRNEAWNHAGSVAAAGLVTVATLAIGAALSSTLGGLLATWFGCKAAFLGLALPAVLALGLAMRLLGQASSAKAAVISARV
jgi:hypothetical protein